jgi:hypothetical protein
MPKFPAPEGQKIIPCCKHKEKECGVEYGRKLVD